MEVGEARIGFQVGPGTAVGVRDGWLGMGLGNIWSCR